MTARPILWCGAGVEDCETIAAVAEEFARALVHVPDPAAPADLGEPGPACVLVEAPATPGGDFAVCRHWKTVHPEVPLVLVAPDDALETKMDAVGAGADHFLVSPIDEEALRFVFRFVLVEQGR